MLSSVQKNILKFVEYKKNDFLQLNKYSILEPVFSAEKLLEEKKLDVVLVPLLAFDLNGHRLGSGGGYYDRTFSFLVSRERPLKPYLIGIGYNVQQSNDLEEDEWDIVLDGMLTDKKLILSF